MRFVLVLAGVVSLTYGAWLVMAKPPAVDGAALEIRHSLFVIVGAILLAAGLATIDIVATLQGKKG